MAKREKNGFRHRWLPVNMESDTCKHCNVTRKKQSKRGFDYYSADGVFMFSAVRENPPACVQKPWNAKKSAKTQAESSEQ